ncbi:hypothetical protein ACI797_17465 [Geodermatophilus sp. SYSU D00691]
MSGLSRPAVKARLAVGAALGIVVAVVCGYYWSWDASGFLLLAVLGGGIGYYAVLLTVVAQLARAAEKAARDDAEPRNVPIGL